MEIYKSTKSSKGNHPYKLRLKLCGNLVILDSLNTVLWETITSVSEPVLKMKDDGDLILSNNADKKVFWNSKTGSNNVKESSLNSGQNLNENWKLESPNGKHKAILKSDDGNFVLYVSYLEFFLKLKHPMY